MSFKKERDNLESSASKLLALALKGGAEHAEVCATYGSETTIRLEKQDFHLASSNDGYQFGLRVLKNGKLGFTSCNSLDPNELKEVATRGLEIANFSPPNPNWTIRETSNLASGAPTQLWDEEIVQTSLQTQREWAELIMDECLKDSRFRLNEGNVTKNHQFYLVINSHGTSKFEAETGVTWGVMGMGVEGDLITSFDYFQDLARKRGGIQDKILATTHEFRDSILRNLKVGPSKSYKGPVFFSARAVIDILISGLTYHLSGRNVAEKTARWGMTDLGKAVLSPALNVTDNPWLPDRFGCSAFDREGTPTKPMDVFKEGVILNFFTDNYSGTALSKPSSGHASGGPTSIPGVGPHLMCIRGGKTPFKELAKQAKQDFLLIHRFSGQTDPITGDFSGVAKGAEWWSSGEFQHHVKETLVSGNLFESLGRNLIGVSKETQIIDSAEESPTLVIDSISVTAGQ